MDSSTTVVTGAATPAWAATPTCFATPIRVAADLPVLGATSAPVAAHAGARSTDLLGPVPRGAPV